MVQLFTWKVTGRDSPLSGTNALTGVFSHVTLIPGSLLLCAVASGEPVTPSVARLASERDIETSYVNSDYLIDSEIKTREQILSHVDRDAAMNTALRPVTSLFANVLFSWRGWG
ncbi:MAG: hypothetical protein R2758_15170 [Bacteroidales bacterium]